METATPFPIYMLNWPSHNGRREREKEEATIGRRGKPTAAKWNGCINLQKLLTGKLLNLLANWLMIMEGKTEENSGKLGKSLTGWSRSLHRFCPFQHDAITSSLKWQPPSRKKQLTLMVTWWSNLSPLFLLTRMESNFTIYPDNAKKMTTDDVRWGYDQNEETAKLFFVFL